mmetsp:Transcript_80488/g.193026  ORF Transcript_80488/g.193026 Transcript_80488/m.193026 type:complete len:261 (-) Transcript_80488:3143-3925(-)
MPSPERPLCSAWAVETLRRLRSLASRCLLEKFHFLSTPSRDRERSQRRCCSPCVSIAWSLRPCRNPRSATSPWPSIGSLSSLGAQVTPSWSSACAARSRPATVLKWRSRRLCPKRWRTCETLQWRQPFDAEPKEHVRSLMPSWRASPKPKRASRREQATPPPTTPSIHTCGHTQFRWWPPTRYRLMSFGRWCATTFLALSVRLVPEAITRPRAQSRPVCKRTALALWPRSSRSRRPRCWQPAWATWCRPQCPWIRLQYRS